MSTMTYEEEIYSKYVNGGEGERLKMERLYPDIVGLYEHKKCFTPWPANEARELQSTARNFLFDPCHVLNHCGDWSDLARENCGVCVLNGYPYDGNEPNWSGWARVYVQAQVAIPEEWREAFAALLNEPSAYSKALNRDIATFGLRDGRGLIKS